jgi:hypothetical protein
MDLVDAGTYEDAMPRNAVAGERTRIPRKGRPATGTLELRKSGWYARLTVTIDGKRVRKWFDLETSDKNLAKHRAFSMTESEAKKELKRIRPANARPGRMRAM